MLWLPPLQQDALGQHPCFFVQHSGVSPLPPAQLIANGVTITVARIAISANFLITKFPPGFQLASISACFDRLADVCAAK